MVKEESDVQARQKALEYLVSHGYKKMEKAEARKFINRMPATTTRISGTEAVVANVYPTEQSAMAAGKGAARKLAENSRLLLYKRLKETGGLNYNPTFKTVTPRVTKETTGYRLHLTPTLAYLPLNKLKLIVNRLPPKDAVRLGVPGKMKKLAVQTYVAAHSCPKMGLKHDYKHEPGKKYEKCLRCGSSRTLKPNAMERELSATGLDLEKLTPIERELIKEKKMDKKDAEMLKSKFLIDKLQGIQNRTKVEQQ